MGRTVPGFLRPHPRAPILPFLYDFDTNTAGIYKGAFVMCTTEPYLPSVNKISDFTLLHELVVHDDWVGAFTVNNNAVLGLGIGFCMAAGLNGITLADNKYTRLIQPACHLTWKPKTQVGWVKTVPPRMDLPVPPYALLVDSKGMTSINYRDVVPVPGAVPCTDFSLYKELVNRPDCDIVYMTSSGPIFTKGENL